MTVHLTRTDYERFKCWKSNSDKTDDILWNTSEEDGDIRSECEEDEDTDFEDGDSDTEG